MLVLLSDLHLTDGTTARNLRASAFRLLGAEIEAIAAKRTGLRELHVVLLGDIFDLVRTDYWVRNVPTGERPWGGTPDPMTGMNADHDLMERHFGAALEAIFEAESDAARAFVAMLQGLPHVGGTPPKVTYVIGNHDRMLHNLPGLQKRLVDRFDGVDLRLEPKVDLRERYGLLARHGHEWDENCHALAFFNQVLQPRAGAGRFDERVYRAMAIGEVVTAELMAGLIHYVTRDFAGRHWDKPEDLAFLESFKDVNNLRPLTAAFNWLAWFLRGQGKRYDAYMEVMRAGLMDALSSLLRCRFAKQWDRLTTDVIASGDLTDHLGRVLCLVKQKQGLKLLEGLASIIGTFAGRSDGLDTLARGAREELMEGEARGGDFQYLAYGHTHEARHDCFHADHGDFVKFYVNTGTFQPFIERARSGRGFWSAQRMTYAILLGRDENQAGDPHGSPTLDLWDGLRR